MIRNYRNESAFNASEDYLLVPMPVGLEMDLEGFAGQVLGRFPLAGIRLKDNRGLKPGEALVIGRMDGDARWLPAYSLALCGLHRRAADGWADTPQYLRTALDSLAANDCYRPNGSVATAGIPGTGFSGLRGNASPKAIQQVLESHRLAVTVYQDDHAGDRAALQLQNPVDLDARV